MDTQFNDLTNHNSVKVPKVDNPTNKKRNYKSLGTIVMNSTMAPPSLVINNYSLIINKLFAFEGGTLAVYYTYPQSFKITLVFSFVGLTTLGTLVNFVWLVH